MIYCKCFIIPVCACIRSLPTSVRYRLAQYCLGRMSVIKSKWVLTRQEPSFIPHSICSSTALCHNRPARATLWGADATAQQGSSALKRTRVCGPVLRRSARSLAQSSAQCTPCCSRAHAPRHGTASGHQPSLHSAHTHTRTDRRRWPARQPQKLRSQGSRAGRQKCGEPCQLPSQPS